MADVFSTIAAAIGVADVGARVSAKLYTFGVLVASADETISSISKDVALTSTVLKELGLILAKDRPESPIVTKTAIMNIKETVQECDKAFEQIDSILLKRVPKLRLGKGDYGPKAAVILERFGWQAVEPKVRLLRSNIDRLKSSLLLMLNVLMLAWFISDSDQSIEASNLTPVKLTSKVSPTSSDNPGAQHSFNLDPNREPSWTQLMSEPHQIVGVGALSDQTNLASYKMTVLRNLQQDYNDLFLNLIDEVRAQKYDIDQASRSRIESQIAISRSNELSHLDLMASTTSALRYPSYKQNVEAQRSSDSVSHTVVNNIASQQSAYTTPAYIVKSDTDNADRGPNRSRPRKRTRMTNPPTDSESQRARLGRYMKYYNPPGFGIGGGRGAYDVAGPAIPPPPKPRDSTNQKSEQQKHTSEAIVLNDASSNEDEARNRIWGYKSFSTPSASAPPQEINRQYREAQTYIPPRVDSCIRRHRSHRSSIPTKIEAPLRLQLVYEPLPPPLVGFYSNDEPQVSQGPKSTISDLLALWTTIPAA